MPSKADNMFADLRGRGFTGSIADMMMQLLVSKGATSGSIADRARSLGYKLIGEFFELPPNAIVLSDDFNRADNFGGTVGWTLRQGPGWNTYLNCIYPSGSNSVNTFDAAGNNITDCEVEYTTGSPAGVDNGTGIMLRVKGDSGYFAEFSNGGMSIWKCVAGVYTKIAANAESVPVPIYTAKVTIVGQVITSYLNGVQKNQATMDGSFIEGAVGVRGDGGAYIDSFKVTTSAPSPSSDFFSRADNPTSMGSLWASVSANTWGIINNQAYNNSGLGGQVTRYLSSINCKNYDVEFDIPVGDGGSAVVFRYVDENNFYMFIVGGGLFSFYRKLAGNFTAISPNRWGSVSPGRYKISVVDNTFIAYVDGVQLDTTADNNFDNKGGIGLRADTSNARFDNLTFTPK